MADDIDIANSLMDHEISRALNKLRQKSTLSFKKGPQLCIECGDKIPPARQKLGFKFCVPCAQDAERRRSLFVDQ